MKVHKMVSMIHKQILDGARSRMLFPRQIHEADSCALVQWLMAEFCNSWALYLTESWKRGAQRTFYPSGAWPFHRFCFVSSYGVNASALSASSAALSCESRGASFRLHCWYRGISILALTATPSSFRVTETGSG